ncbi:CG12715, partial [Drosophila busckii]
MEQLLQANKQHNWSPGCAPYPLYDNLHLEQTYFQFVQGGNDTYHLYSAHYDNRKAVANAPRVVVLGMVSNILGPYSDGYCQLWYEHSDRPDIVPMLAPEIVWYKEWGHGGTHVYPALMTCPLLKSPRRYRVPQLVSIVFGEPCAKANNALLVGYEAPQRNRSTRFAVCVKDLEFPKEDRSDRFVEWLELMRLLGAERVTAYNTGADKLMPNTWRTLNFYAQQDGLLQLRDYKLLEGHPLPGDNFWLLRCLNEVLMYLDCLYRSMYNFDYVGVFDVDEVIMPLGKFHNWHTLLEHLEQNSSLSTDNCKARTSYCFRNVYFSKELPEDETPPANFYMLRHVRRVAQHLDTVSAIKCLHSTAYSTAVHNHFTFYWEEACGPFDVPTAIGQMQHYREPDIKETLTLPTPVRDDNIWRFKDHLISRAHAIHRLL